MHYVSACTVVGQDIRISSDELRGGGYRSIRSTIFILLVFTTCASRSIIFYPTPKVSSYSALFAVRCGALSYSSSNFNGTCVNVPQRTVTDAEYKRTFNNLR